MAEIPKTPVILITGSLGSGKTTLLRHIIGAAPPSPAVGLQRRTAGSGNSAGGPTAFRIALLMNEFGELAVDSRVIGGKNIDVIELLGGCVCCSMTGEFEAAVREIIETISPDFIVVEATGVAESDALVFEVEEGLPEVRLDSVVCIVDAYLGIKYPQVGYTSRTQIASADIILINKVDLVGPGEAQTVEAGLRKYNDRALFLRTVNCGVDVNLLFGQTSGRSALFPLRQSAPQAAGRAVKTTAKGRQARPGKAPVPAEVLPQAPLHSFTWATDKILDCVKFDGLVREFPTDLIRAKGFVRFENGGRLFNYIVGRADFEEFNVDRTELVFIGHNLDGLRPELEKRLRGCEAG